MGNNYSPKPANDSVSIIFKPNLQVFIITLEESNVNKCDEETIKKMMSHLPRR